MIGQIAGNVAGSLIGGYFGNKAAKHQAAADRYAVDQQMRPFLLKEPFLKDLYSGAQGALNNALNTGAFTGPTYAGLDPMQMRGITGMGAFGDRALGLGSSFMDTGQGFAQNAQNIFDRAGGRTLDDAVNYAASSPQAAKHGTYELKAGVTAGSRPVFLASNGQVRDRFLSSGPHNRGA